MKKNLLFLFLIIITILSINVMAGYNPNTFFSTGSVSLDTSTAALIVSGYVLDGVTPITWDFETDGDEEIILVDESNTTYIVNFTGTGFSSTASYYVGDASRFGQKTHYTPDTTGSCLGAGTNRCLVAVNSTHVMTFNYSVVSGLQLVQSVVLPQEATGSFANQEKFFEVNCANLFGWGGASVCFIPFMDRIGGSYIPQMGVYDVTNNVFMNTTLIGESLANRLYQQYQKTYLADIDLDGVVEGVYALRDSANGDLHIHLVQQTSATTISDSEIYMLDMAAGYYIADIQIGNFDGIISNGWEIAMFYRNSAGSYAARIINRAGTVLKAFTSKVITTTDATPLRNLAVTSDYEIFCSYVEYPTVGKLWCFEGNTGDYEATTVNKTGYNVTGGTFRIFDQFTNADGLLNGGYLSKLYTTSFNLITFFDVPFLTYATTTFFSAVYGTGSYTDARIADLRGVGLDDILFSNNTNMAVLNSLASNQAPTISAYGVGTGNPTCLNVYQRYKVTVTDSENDGITCHFGYYMINTSLLSEEVKVQAASTEFEFLKLLDTVGSYTATIRCGDSDHKNVTSHTFLQTVINSTTGCYQQDEGGSSTTVTTQANETTQNSAFEADLESLYGGMGAGSKLARNIIALILCIAVVVTVYLKTKSELISVICLPMVMLLCYFLKLATIFPLVMTIIVGIVGAVWLLMSGRSSSTGG